MFTLSVTAADEEEELLCLMAMWKKRQRKWCVRRGTCEVLMKRNIYKTSLPTQTMKVAMDAEIRYALSEVSLPQLFAGSQRQ